MSEKSPSSAHVVMVIDKKTMNKIQKLAARYGIESQDVILELMRMEASERPQGVTVH